MILSPLHFEVPQNRNRVLIIGVKKGFNTLPVKPTYAKQITNIYNILEDDEKISEKILNEVSLKPKQINILEIWEKFILYFKNKSIKLPTFPIWTVEWEEEKLLENINNIRAYCGT